MKSKKKSHEPNYLATSFGKISFSTVRLINKLINEEDIDELLAEFNKTFTGNELKYAIWCLDKAKQNKAIMSRIIVNFANRELDKSSSFKEVTKKEVQVIEKCISLALKYNSWRTAQVVFIEKFEGEAQIIAMKKLLNAIVENNTQSTSTVNK